MLRNRYAEDISTTEQFLREARAAAQLNHPRIVSIHEMGRVGDTIYIATDLVNQCRDVDQPCWALIQDLKQNGLLDDTLVVWGGEFGRMPFSEGKGAPGRNHNPYGFSMWLAGGDVKGGQTYGATDDLGYNAVENIVHVRDLHATILWMCGLDHRQLKFNGSGLDVIAADDLGDAAEKMARENGISREAQDQYAYESHQKAIEAWEKGVFDDEVMAFPVGPDYLASRRASVIGMGKLGAGELNFSSDVDLIFTFPASGETTGGRRPLSNEAFFTRLCRYLIQAIGETTVDGRANGAPL